MGGTVGGFIGTILSHPFDTIKNRIQTGNPYNVRNIRDLYSGITLPLYGIALEKTIVFGSYNTTKNILDNYYENTIIKSGISGLVAGFLCTIIVTPVEKIKINLQNYKYNNQKQNIYTNLYKGWTATLTREVPGYSIYFMTYEIAKQYITKSDNKIVYLANNFLLGGLCGITSWIFIYPQDRIKTIIQNTTSEKKIVDVIKEITLKEGYKGLYKGFSLCLLRSIPLHSGVFFGYGIVEKYF